MRFSVRTLLYVTGLVATYAVMLGQTLTSNTTPALAVLMAYVALIIWGLRRM